MRLDKILTAVVPALALMGCGDLSGAGKLRLEPLPANLAADCPRPEALLSRGGTVADDELSIGRLGDALLICGAQKRAVVGAYDEVRSALSN